MVAVKKSPAPKRGAEWIRPPGPVADGLRIGLLGGSFNPAHGGHLHVTEVALDRLHLDYVWWLVSPQNPLKPAKGMASFAERTKSAKKIAKHPRVRVSGIEQQLGTRYTVDTVKALKQRFPRVKFVWLMGSDNLNQFSRWRRWKEIAAMVPIAVVVRPGAELASLNATAVQHLSSSRLRDWGHIADAETPALVVIEAPRNELTSTAIRAAGHWPR